MNEEPHVIATNTRKSRLLARSSVVGGAIATLLVLAGCGSITDPGGTPPMSSDPARPFSGTRTADVMEKDFYDTIEDTIKQSGTQFPTWNRETEDGVMQTTCAVGSENGNFFSITLNGGSVPDPKAATNKIKTYWESKGWKIETIFDNTDRPVPGVQIAATSSTGIEVVYNASAGSSMIEAKSDCSLDPSLNSSRNP